MTMRKLVWRLSNPGACSLLTPSPGLFLPHTGTPEQKTIAPGPEMLGEREWVGEVGQRKSQGGGTGGNKEKGEGGAGLGQFSGLGCNWVLPLPSDSLLVCNRLRREMFGSYGNCHWPKKRLKAQRNEKTWAGPTPPGHVTGGKG